MGTSRQPRNLLLPLSAEIKGRGFVGAQVLRSLEKAGTALEPGSQGSREPGSYTGDIREGREGHCSRLLPAAPPFGSTPLRKRSPLQYRSGERVGQSFRSGPKMPGTSAGALALICSGSNFGRESGTRRQRGPSRDIYRQNG